jgi:Leucine-rich repeat (LRR) protein
LREKLDGTLTELVKVLELRNSKLKDFDDMFTNKHFPNLTELDISCNEFTTMKMLGNLPTLTILVLTHNKIDSLLCSTDINMPKGLNGCQNLYILDLSNNYLKDFNGLQFCRLG